MSTTHCTPKETGIVTCGRGNLVSSQMVSAALPVAQAVK